MKKILYLFILAIVSSSCNYTIYDMNRGDLKMAKKATYQVEYMTDVPEGTTATITYRGENNVKYIEQSYKGKLDKVVTLPSGQKCIFTVNVKLPKTTPKSSLHTLVKVDGETIVEENQSGKNVKFSIGFTLP
jgi:hypothetical protein